MEIAASSRRARITMLAASLWTSVTLSCAHAQEPPTPSASAAVASEPSEPAAPAEPSPTPESAPAEPTPTRESAPAEPTPTTPQSAPAALSPTLELAPAAPTPKAESAPSCGTGAEPRPFRWPVPGSVTSPFGLRRGDPHEGIDISSRAGMAVRAAAPGTVVFSDYKPGYGRVIVLKHAGGYKTVYAHNQDNLVLEGARVKQGQVIADMGRTGEATGPHLHFEIRVGDRPVDPLDCLPVRAKAK